jgi:hypothetical protein
MQVKLTKLPRWLKSLTSTGVGGKSHWTGSNGKILLMRMMPECGCSTNEEEEKEVVVLEQ